MLQHGEKLAVVRNVAEGDTKMSMEARARKHYYYTATGADGRVVKRYFGEAAIAKAGEFKRARDLATNQRAEIEKANRD